MLRNLMAEMVRKGLSNKDIAKVIERDEKTVFHKIACKTDFTRREMVEIKKAFFPDLTLEYLFEQTDEKEVV